MEFGRLADVSGVDFTLPPEDPSTAAFLQSLPHSGPKGEVRLGAPAWGRKEWVGRIYPEGCSARDYLHHYSRWFDCIELNSTHYRIPEIKTIAGWVSAVPEHFLFCPKFPSLISHEPGGLEDPVLLRLWLGALEAFGDNLGPTFIQFPPNFTYERRRSLYCFLENWPAAFPLALEFRHPSWFQTGRVLPRLVDYLQKKMIGLVITDVAGRRDVCHGSVTSSFCLLRFIGNDQHPSDASRIDSWVNRLAGWGQSGLPRVYWMVHQPDDLHAPETTQQIRLRVGTSAHLVVRTP